VRGRPGDLLELKTNLPDDASPDAADVELLCGEFEFRGRRRSALLEALPEAVAVEFAGRPGFAWLEGLVRLMAQEVERPQPGSTALVGELAGALFTLALRAHLATHPAHDGVLGLMRSERLAPALKAMLDEPAAPWTVETLAARCHLSRARFARLFVEQAGCAPLAMLTRLRMELAARLLSQGGQETAAVGEAVGYRSEAAFNRAFARHAGVPPGRFRRQAQADSAAS
jgi:AraC family transcriptional activator of mtrCDE